MRVAITGAGGLLGNALVRAFGERHTVFPLARIDADITDREQTFACLRGVVPDVVIHSAAIRDPDIAEATPSEAFRVNVHGTRNVVDAAADVGAAVAYISTDSVFDGRKRSPYIETDGTIPPTVYGRTKLWGERLTSALPRYWIFRISVLFGPGRNDFVDKALDAASGGPPFYAALDQMGTVTYTPDAAQAMLQVVESGSSGIYHVCSQGAASRYESARRAAEIVGLDASRIVGKTSAEMGRRAVRLEYAVMAMDALERGGFTLPRPWPEAMAEYIHSKKTG